MSVINFQDFAAKRQAATRANVTQGILETFTLEYMSNLANYDVNLEDPAIAFDIATIQFLMRGMAHRSQGESHPSQIILDKLKGAVVG